jgi:hypothetical protein
MAVCKKADGTGQVAAALQKFVHDDVYSGDKFEKAFGFRASITLREGIRREVADLYSSSRL